MKRTLASKRLSLLSELNTTHSMDDEGGEQEKMGVGLNTSLTLLLYSSSASIHSTPS